jgi:hypothetical protein
MRPPVSALKITWQKWRIYNVSGARRSIMGAIAMHYGDHSRYQGAER